MYNRIKNDEAMTFWTHMDVNWTVAASGGTEPGGGNSSYIFDERP